MVSLIVLLVFQTLYGTLVAFYVFTSCPIHILVDEACFWASVHLHAMRSCVPNVENVKIKSKEH